MYLFLKPKNRFLNILHKFSINLKNMSNNPFQRLAYSDLCSKIIKILFIIFNRNSLKFAILTKDGYRLMFK
jgi:hypothetical protein